FVAGIKRLELAMQRGLRHRSVVPLVGHVSSCPRKGMAPGLDAAQKPGFFEEAGLFCSGRLPDTTLPRGPSTEQTSWVAAEAAADALAQLKKGNARFVADDLASRATYGDQRRRLAQQGQKPLAVVLACSDSRVVPELIFDRQLGELFVIRVAGNVTDPVVIG